MIAPDATAANLVPPPSLSAGISVRQAADLADPDIILADHRHGYRADRDWRGRHAERDWKRRHAERDRYRRRADRDWDRHHYKGHPYKRGYRGSRKYRHGYRRDNDGWWFPLAAFALGAVLLEQQKQRRPYDQSYSSWDHIPAGNMNAHDNWCDRRYRSYSRVSKTFQPYNGPRRYCNSPYDLL
ncbi:BA14K family protein [Sulfitobacter sabulilitoris]|uniref:Lectin-like protein BA14k n=2 Tax=Sulfitobacter sabulilitoris TaxID=2562655 RepID=A0A5S3Q5F3_9RHOB|nr:BA14K family protein [Sulfitobacter sabulilitoris]